MNQAPTTSPPPSAAPGLPLEILGSAAHGAHSVADASNPGASIEYQRFLDCVHCGLCTASCPTYVETGNENDSPRGRIYLMRAVTDGRLEMNHEVRRHLELCLDCRACETACPSGVQYGKLIEPFRIGMEQSGEGEKKSEDWFHRWILFRLFPYASRMRTALAPARWAQQLRLPDLAIKLGLTRLLPGRLRQLVEMLPPLGADLPPLPDFLKASGKRRGRVALFTGCVGDSVFRATNWATARVLQANGLDVIVSPDQVCCGAIHFHAGSSEPARQFANQNVKALSFRDVDAVVVNVAGCGAMLKDYGHHWHDEESDERAEFARKVKDVNQFLDEIGLIPPTGEIRVTATYHDACHLRHAQKVYDAPRRLLAKIPGLVLKDLAESDLCCGAAGTYNLTEPEMSARLSARKMSNIRDTKARIVLTANAGCLLQIAREARRQNEKLWVAHPMDLLDMSYRGVKPPV